MNININQIINKAIDSAIEGDHDYFITLENNNDSKHWIQTTYSSINIYYPFSEEPTILFEKYQLPIYPDMEIIGWENNKYLTLGYNAEDLNNTEIFILQYLDKILDWKDGKSWIISDN